MHNVFTIYTFALSKKYDYLKIMYIISDYGVINMGIHVSIYYISNQCYIKTSFIRECLIHQRYL